MSKTVVFYKSRYGVTKKYVQYLKEELSCDMMAIEDANVVSLAKYNAIVFGGGVYAGAIAGFSFIKKNFDKLKDKKLIVFAVGASEANEDTIEEIRKRHFTGDLSDIPFYYCRGAWDEELLSLPHKLLIRVIKRLVSNKKREETDNNLGSLSDTMGAKADWTDKSYLEPIIQQLREVEDEF